MRYFVLLLVASLWTVPSIASEYSASHIAAAVEVVESMNTESALKTGVELSLAQQLEMNAELREYEHVLRAFFERYMSWEIMRDRYALLYAQHFSEAELREMSVFFGSNTGKKYALLVPDLIAAGGKLGEQVVNENVSELHRMMMEAMAARQAKETTQ